MDSSQTQIGILTESSWGVRPSPSTFDELRLTGEGFKIKRDNVVSDEIRSDRNVSNIIQIGGGAEGSLNGEMSYSAYDSLLESAFFSAFASDVMVNGTTQKSFQIQKKQSNGTNSVFELYAGMIVDEFNLDLKAKDKITCNLNFIGKDGTISNIETGTTNAAPTEEIMDASNGFTLSSMLVSPTPCLMSLKLAIKNNLREQPCAGQVALKGVGAGRCLVTGSAEVYFENKSLMDLYLAGTGGGISFTIGSVTGKKYTFYMPSVKIMNAEHVSGGNDQDIMLSFDYQAIYNSTLGGEIQLTRAVA